MGGINHDRVYHINHQSKPIKPSKAGKPHCCTKLAAAGYVLGNLRPGHQKNAGDGSKNGGNSHLQPWNSKEKDDKQC